MSVKIRTFYKGLIACLAAAALPHAALAQGATDLGTVSVEAAAARGEGAGDRGAPLLAEQNGTAAATTLRREDIARQPGTANLAQRIGGIAGVNSYSRDPSGLFGGGYSIRGFDSTQIGLSLNGVPLNDPGTFSVLPQIYTDSENLCAVDVTQGTSAGTVAQHGAIGGQVSMEQCRPADAPAVTFSQSFGSYFLNKTFLRANTGPLFDEVLKGYVSYSHARSDYFAGPGEAERHHVDSRFDVKLDNGGSISFTSFYNEFANTFVRAVTKDQYQAFGYRNGWLRTPPTILTGPGATFSATGLAVTPTPANTGYSGYSWEPGRHAYASIDGRFPLSDGVELRLTPYFLHQESGSTSEIVLKEAGYAGKFLSSPIGAFSAYGTRGTNALLGQMSQSDFDRVGNVVSLTGRLDDHTVTGSLWTEYTYQHQMNPFQQIDQTNNTLPDIWFKSNLLRGFDGNIVTNRNWKTDYYNTTVAISDSISLLDDAVHVDLSLRQKFYSRSFHNLPSGTSTRTDSYLDYTVNRSYAFLLPAVGMRYDLDAANQVFANASMNARVPPNFADGRLVNGATNLIQVPTIKAERALSFDLGYRLKGDFLNVNATGFLIKYSDRIAQTANGDGSLSSKYTNIGSTTAVGAEVEVATKPYEGWSVLLSQAINHDTIDGNIVPDPKSPALRTKGKFYFNSPLSLTAATVMYEDGPFFAFARAKYTSEVYATLTNDISLPGYATVDLGLGYKLKGTSLVEAIPGAQDGLFKLNVTNLFNKKYIYINPGNTTGFALSAANAPSFYLGSPFAVTASLTLDF
ncbi:TonB-dependent receptor [Methylobacterium sp. WSM2598]|uniref:TonB-dependent receptor n=1 Tax=Methylobacterium sp. WSM2598 TaxID=398261 RepID=UPI00035DDE1B|nr:TonB-dependent receptor [Methylobacterium sp. WSM2598]